MSDGSEVWVTVPTPGRKSPRRLTGVGVTFKAKMQRNRLLAVLQDPPPDYDGTNAKLAEAMNMSVRQVIRILRQLEAEGSIRILYEDNKREPGGCITTRMIQILKKENT